MKTHTLKQIFSSALFMLCMALSTTLHAGEKREIVLTDDSIIVGEVLSMTDGIYTVKTETLGVLRIEDSRVKSIGGQSSRAVGPVTSSGQQEIAAITQRMIADGSVMQQVQALQNDPDIQEILQDESIMRAINSGDFSALMNNPKIIKLMEKSSVQQINKLMQ